MNETFVLDAMHNNIIKTGLETQGFKKTIEHYVPLSGYDPRTALKILNIGCGICNEAEVLTEYFPNAVLTGIDRDKEDIKMAKYATDTRTGLFLRKRTDNPKYNFIAGDARKLTQLVEGEFDVVISRHPNIIDETKNWGTIYREAKKVLKNDGIFIATEFDYPEFTLIEETIEKLGYNIVLSCENEFAVNRGCFKSCDRNILIAKK